MSEATLGHLETAERLLTNPDGLRATMHREGYLFLPGFAADLVRPLAKRCASELRSQGVAEADGNGLRWTGVDLHEYLDHERLHEATAYDDLWRSDAMTALFEAVLGADPYVFKQTQLRVVAPTYERYDTPMHQDSSYIDNDVFRTVWVPLVDTEMDTGGIALAARSQSAGQRTHVETEQESFTGRFRISGIPEEDVHEPWLTAPFRRGDVLVFHSHTVHRSIPNRSERRLRVSMDTRIQPVSTPRGFVATHTALEIRRAVLDAGGLETVRATSAPAGPATIAEVERNTDVRSH